MASPSPDQSRDVESSPLPHLHQDTEDYNPRNSGIGAALSLDSASSQHGTDAPSIHDDAEWGPQHPCYPHLNPYVPLSSPLYQSTRIIRIRRNWMIAGDLAPTFSGLYPEILADAGLQEGEFRRVVETVNTGLIEVFQPWGWRNVIDAILGLLTGWIWDDLGFTYAKRGLKKVEARLEKWNAEQEKSGRAQSRVDMQSRTGIGSRSGIQSRAGLSSRAGMSEAEEGVQAKFIGLRRSGYLSLDIQIPTPRIGEVGIEGDGAADAEGAHASGEVQGRRSGSAGQKSIEN